jgi:hypothetical protein
MLLFSCSQYEIRNQVVESTFNSELYDAFKEGNIELFFNNSISKEHSLKSSKEILVKINDHYGTDLHIPDNFFQLFLDKNNDKDDMLKAFLKNGWMNQNDINLTNELIENINSKGYDSAIDVFKNKTLALNLSEEEFSKKNTLINLLEIVHDENPNLIEANYFLKEQGPWTCAWATLLFIAALAGLASCATVVLCGLAVASLAGATDYLADSCYQYNPDIQ